MFKRKTYFLEITFTDSSRIKHSNVSYLSLSGNVLSFSKEEVTFKYNWDKLYCYALKEE